MNRRNKWILAIAILFQSMIVAYLVIDALRTGHGGWVLLFTVGLLLTAYVGVCLASFLRFGRTMLVLDAQGIWVEGRHREGIRWEDLEGYEEPRGDRTPILRVWGRNGNSLQVPKKFGVVIVVKDMGTITRELDRRLGPDGDRPSLPTTSSRLGTRLRHHYYQIPTVEMGPGVVYRYTDPEALAEDAKGYAWITSGVTPLIPISAALAVKYPVLTWPIATMGILVAIFAVFIIAQSFTLAYGFRDRFIRRGDEIWRIRNGHETRLPPPSSGPVRKIYDQPTTIHGTGPFAYRMAPQFLEPDV